MPNKTKKGGGEKRKREDANEKIKEIMFGFYFLSL